MKVLKCLYIFILSWISCNGSIPLTLVLIRRDGGLCQSCRFDYQQWVLKTFPGLDYLRSKDGVAWLYHLLVHLYVYSTRFHLPMAQPFDLVLIGRDGGVSTLSHSCKFDYIYIYMSVVFWYLYYLSFFLRHSVPFLQFWGFWVWCPLSAYSKNLRKFDLFSHFLVKNKQRATR